MRLWVHLCLAASSALALCACDALGSADREGVRAVGSSTVYPFAVAVAEALATAQPELDAATVESVGSGEGIRQFCAGDGLDTPDIANASRRMTKAEFETCQANGVTEIIELLVGLDGIVFASASQGGLSMPLTAQLVYRALAQAPYDARQTAGEWSDLAPSLPRKPILIYGPPATSGTRDALKELVLKPGCQAESRMAALGKAEPDRFESVCTTVREDGAYVEQGERDELIVAKVAENPDALAIFGYSYFEENTDKVKALPVGGIEPTYETIANGQYPVVRPLYVYVKKSHIDRVAGLRPYLEQWSRSWGRDGPLARHGLVAASDKVQANNGEALETLEPMTGQGLL